MIGPSWPNCSLVLCTWPMKSMNPSPDFGTPCSGQSVNWNWRTVRDWPSWRKSNVFLFTENNNNNTCHNIGVDQKHKLKAYPSVGDFKLSENVLGHVVLSHRIHHKVLVPGWALCRPVLVALLLKEDKTKPFAQKGAACLRCARKTVSDNYLMEIISQAYKIHYLLENRFMLWNMMTMRYHSLHRFYLSLPVTGLSASYVCMAVTHIKITLYGYSPKIMLSLIQLFFCLVHCCCSHYSQNPKYSLFCVWLQ